MSAAEDRQQEMHPDEIDERLAVVEEMLADKKVKLPDDVFANALEGLENIREKLEKRLPVYESDFEFIEDLKLAVKIGAEYGEAMENLKDGDLYNPKLKERKRLYRILFNKEKPKDEKAPTKQEAINMLMAKLTPEQKEIISKMKKPVFLVEPITTWDRFYTNLIKVSQTININIEFKIKEGETAAGITDGITGWKIGFVEGEPELNGKDGDCYDLLEEWQTGILAKKGAKLLTCNEYALIMARAIKKGQIIDYKGFSVLREEGKKEWIGEGIIGGDGRLGVPRLDSVSQIMFWKQARFRYAVMIKI